MLVYSEIAHTKRQQAKKYSGDTRKALEAQADYFESLAASQDKQNEMYDEIMDEVDFRIAEMRQSLVAERNTHGFQTPVDEGSNPSGATTLRSRAKRAWRVLRGGVAER